MRPESTLDGKVVIVTGAGRGLGWHMSVALARAGARILALGLTEHIYDAFKGEDPSWAGRIICARADVTVPDECARSVQQALDEFGAVHGLVNNAAIGMQTIGKVLPGSRKPFYEVSTDAWKSVFDVNCSGAFFMAQAATPIMLRQSWGRIINVVTSKSTMVSQGFSPYGPSKAALEAATVVWARDLEGTGLTVNALLPGGAADTRMIPKSEVSDRSSLVQPEVMGPPIVWLMSDQANATTAKRIIARDWKVAFGDSMEADALEPAGW